MGMISEFKEFALKGNMMDMAVGIILGAAFGTAIKSLVEDVIMPPIGYMMGKVDFSAMAWSLPVDDGEPVLIKYGSFLNNCFALLIVAMVLFFIIKSMNAANKADEDAPTAKNCGECQMEIPIEAKKCGFCTSSV